MADTPGNVTGGLSNPSSPSGQRINELFWIVTWIAFGVGILVCGLVTIALVRFRVKGGAPALPEKPEDGAEGAPAKPTVHTHRGSTRLEIAWTAAAAVTLLIIGALSAQTLFLIENPPEGPSMTIDVIAHQWSWEFNYTGIGVKEFHPSLSEMHVPVGVVIKLNLTSTDVIHAFWVSELGLKIDTVPGRINHQWFRADREGRFLGQCAEFCGLAHADMRFVVVAESQAAFGAWVAAKKAGPVQPPTKLSSGVVNITLKDFLISPSSLDIIQGSNISFFVKNEGASPHNLSFGSPYENYSLPEIPSGGSAWLNISFTEVVAGGEYWCAVDGHKLLGMNGTFNVSAVVVRVFDVYIQQTPGSHGSWSIFPEEIDVDAGDHVQLAIRSNASNSQPHNLHIGEPYDLESATINGGETTTLNFIADRAGTFPYWCNVPAHRGLGMEGALKVSGAAGGRAIDVYLEEVAGPHGDWSISPGNITLATGETVTFRIHNNGTTQNHNLKIGEPYNVESPLVAPGNMTTMSFTAGSDATAEYWCNVPGHKGRGMVGSLVIGTGGAGTAIGPQVPGFDITLAGPALALAFVLALHAHGRKKRRN